MNIITDFISLIFPRICAACGNSLWRHEEVLCGLCDFHLPRTLFHQHEANPVARLFYGRARVASAAAFLFFNKGNRVRQLIHQLKYKGRKDIGIFLGKIYGHDLQASPLFSEISLIIPVPLHKKKYMKRGYNQSEQFAIGLSETMKIPVNRHLLVRTRHTDTQTRKTRFGRYQNVKEIFSVGEPQRWENLHLLLVDDVITTGSTLESCIEALQVIPGVRISVACIATAKG
jgi:ComF family protein